MLKEQEKETESRFKITQSDGKNTETVFGAMGNRESAMIADEIKIIQQ
jgi:hypothetical protein